MPVSFPFRLLSLVLLLAALVGAWMLWITWVRWRYRLRGPPPELLFARCADGWELAIYFRPAGERRFTEPVLLCHGIAANHFNFDFERPYSVAHFLSDAGFDCYTVEWRGTGKSRPPKGRRWRDYSADDHIRLDAPALLETALRHSGATQAFWLGHSLGALIGYGAAQSPGGDKIRGLLALAAPVYFRYGSLLRSASRFGPWVAWPFGLRQRLLSVTVAPFLGYLPVPLSSVIANVEAIPPALQRQVMANLISSVGTRLLRQFSDWVSNDVFRSYDHSVDYREGIKQITQPVLVMGGAVDQLAPPACIEEQFKLPSSADKTLVIFGKQNGDLRDYGHGDLLFGSEAPREIYPLFQRWLEAHATRWPTSS